jgi:hypothetical protein
MNPEGGNMLPNEDRMPDEERARVFAKIYADIDEAVERGQPIQKPSIEEVNRELLTSRTKAPASSRPTKPWRIPKVQTEPKITLNMRREAKHRKLRDDGTERMLGHREDEE